MSEKDIVITMLVEYIKKDIKTNIKTLRSRFGMTQEGLAREIGVAFSTVSAHENLRTFPQPRMVKSYAELFAKKFATIDRIRTFLEENS